MLSELSNEVIQNLDIQSEFNPPDVVQYIHNYDIEGLSSQAKNQLRYYEARALSTMRRFEEAEAITIECLSQAILEKDYFILVKCNVLQGICYLQTGGDLRIRPCLEMAVEYAIQSGDFELLVYASSFYLHYLQNQAQFGPALEEEKRIIDLIKRLPPSYTTTNALVSVARLHLDMANRDMAIKYLCQALQSAQSLNISATQLNILNNLASVYTTIKDYTRAEEILLNGLALARELGHKKQVALILLNLGNLMIPVFKYTTAIEYFDQCMAVVQSLEFSPPLFMIDIYNNYSMCYWFLEDKTKSLYYLDQAIEIAKLNKFEKDQIQMEVNKTNILVDSGDYEAAKSIMMRALKFYKKTKNYHQLIWVYRTLANLHQLRKEYKKSYEVCHKLNLVTDEYIAQIQRQQAAPDTEKLNSRDIYLSSTTVQNPVLRGTETSQGFIGRSKAWQNVLNSALLAAQHQNTSVLIIGESGTGKEVIAQIIHKNSVRRNYAFVPVNIGALSSSLIESELFGHTRGAFTGADMPTKGFFLQADKGTLFLDEITEMPYELQSKLLRVIETRKVTSVGSSKEISFDCRIVSATNQNVREQLTLNKFRLDLFHRLNTIEIVIPPLRERPEDIEPILHHYIETYALELKKPQPFVDSSLIELLVQYAFPGNVRELKNIVERMFILSNSLHWDAKLLCSINPFCFGELNPAKQLQPDEEDLILKALIKAKGKQKDAALLLNMSEATLYRRILKYNLQQHTRKGS